MTTAVCLVALNLHLDCATGMRENYIFPKKAIKKIKKLAGAQKTPGSID